MIRPARNSGNREKEAWKDLTDKQKNGIKIGSAVGVVALAVVLILGGIYGGWFGGSLGGLGETHFGIRVYNAWDNANLTTANISYWDSKDNGLPNKMLTFGTMDNVSMITYDFPEGDIWAKVELADFQTVWVLLDTANDNTISMLKLPQDVAVGGIFDSLGDPMLPSTDDNGTIRWTFPLLQNGTGFRPTYNAMSNDTIYITMKCYFSSVPGKDMVKISGEVSSQKTVDSVNKAIVIPVASSLIVGTTTLTNYLELSCEVSHGGSLTLDSIDLLYDGVVFGTVTL